MLANLLEALTRLHEKVRSRVSCTGVRQVTQSPIAEGKALVPQSYLSIKCRHCLACTKQNKNYNNSPVFSFLTTLRCFASFQLKSTIMAIPHHFKDTDDSRPKVLIPEKVSPDGLALLQKTLDIHEKKGLTPEQLLEIIPEYEALIVRSETKVTEALLKAGKKLKVVARAGVGVDNVDVSAATKLGIIVVNSPAGNINAAAEHTVARKCAFR
jgi:hypothetical protein